MNKKANLNLKQVAKNIDTKTFNETINMPRAEVSSPPPAQPLAFTPAFAARNASRRRSVILVTQKVFTRQ